MICADAVCRISTTVMARFYSGATSCAAGRGACLKPTSRSGCAGATPARTPRAWTAPTVEARRAHAAAAGINLRRDLDVPEVAQLIGALAPEPDRVMAPAIARGPAPSRASSSTTTRRARFVIREAARKQTIVLLDIMRHGGQRDAVPTMEEVTRARRSPRAGASR
jgi:hypothetical protein